MEKKLKVILIAIFAILLTLVSFVGIYVNKNGVYKNIIADYILDSNLEEKVVIELAVDKSTNKITYDADGNVVEEKDDTSDDDENSEDKSNYTTVEEPVNPQENLTEENYKKVKAVIEKRLEIMKIKDYKVRLNKENGNIIVEIPKDSKSDKVRNNLTLMGTIELVDAEDKTVVLLSNNEFKDAKALYNTDSDGTTVYLSLNFDKEGKKKLEDISNEYTMVSDEEGKVSEKKVTLRMEDEDILSTYFGEPIRSGSIQLTIGSETTDTEKVKKYIENATDLAMVLNGGKMPLKYKIENEKDISPVINNNVLNIGIYSLLGILVISFIYLIVRYKKYGALTIIGSIIATDILLLIIRYTDVHISVESTIAFIALILLNIYIVANQVKKLEDNFSKETIAKNIKEGWLKSIDMIVVMLILSIVFTFITWSTIGNVGILMFWGIISLGISHLIFTRTLLLNSNK